jgi:hypothetical protein
LFELVKLPVTDIPLPDTPPVNPPVTLGADQLYVVPAGTIPFVPFVGVTLNVAPLQPVAVMALIFAVGFTDTVKENTAPVQPLYVGVTRYVAVWVILVGLVNVPITAKVAVPLAPPVMPPDTDGADQLYVVPDGITPLITSVGVALKNTPLQVVAVIAVTTGYGLTVTVTVNVAPVYISDTGVMI